MALINHNGRITQHPGVALLSDYTTQHSLRTVSVEIWGFENLPYGMIAVAWANGAHGSSVASNLRELHAWAKAITGWPDPLLHSRTLPYNAGFAYIEELGLQTTEVKTYAEPDESSGGIAVRRTRTRAHPVP